MNVRRKNRLYSVLVVLGGITVTTVLILYALRANIDLFYTPGEILQGKGEKQEKPQPGQRLRIGGLVLPGSVKRDAHSLKITFQLYDAKGVVSIVYEGILPDLFREGQGIVAQGILAQDNTIHAREVLAKHDEKYMPPEIAAAVSGNDAAPPVVTYSRGQEDVTL